MRNAIKILLIGFLGLVNSHNAQNRLILNNNPFIVLNNGSKLVLENANANAISQTNGGGTIITESEDNEVVWSVQETSGQTYTVPFGTKPSAQGGNGLKIPVVLTTTSAGTEITNGTVHFSTWETANDDNSPLPSGISSLGDGLTVIDRFWKVQPSDYSTNPEVSLHLAYDESSNEFAGSNTIIEDNLIAQGYNASSNLWFGPFGSVNSSTNTIENIVLNSTEFTSTSSIWTLVDQDYPLYYQGLIGSSGTTDPGASSVGAARIVLTNNSFVVLNNQAKIVLENENANAITEANGGGMIISENENNNIIWHVNENGGQTRRIPFGTKPTIQGGNGVKIPLTLSTSTGGTQNTDGNIVFATWETLNDDNTPLPTGVTHAVDALKAVDRFWKIQPTDYSTNPVVGLTFTYDDNTNEILGTNTLNENFLTAQYYDDAIDKWMATFGGVNVNNNKVSNVSLNSTIFANTNWVWTLVEENFPLPLIIFDFELSCIDNSTELNWEFESDIFYDRMIIECSYDAKNWKKLDEFKFQKSGKFHSENLEEYYRLVMVDFQGELDHSIVLKSNCSSSQTSIQLYPNPTKDLINLSVYGFDNSSLFYQLYDKNGKLLITDNINSNNTLIDLKGFADGPYFLLVADETQVVKTLQVIKN